MKPRLILRLRVNTLVRFPKDIWLLIASLCDYKTLCSLSNTTKTLHTLINGSRQLWLELLSRWKTHEAPNPRLSQSNPRRMLASFIYKRCFACGSIQCSWSSLAGCFACKNCIKADSNGPLATVSATMAKKLHYISEELLQTLKSSSFKNEYKKLCHYYLLEDVRIVSEQYYGTEALQKLRDKCSARLEKAKEKKASKQRVMD